MMAHMGVSVSLGTIRNTVKSLRKNANLRLKNLPPGNMIYDNFDMDFKVAQPVAGHQGTHMSVTAATFAPYIGVNLEDLRFTEELHKTSRFNKDLQPNDPKIYKLTFRDVLPRVDSSSPAIRGLDSLSRAFAWHLRAILVEQEPTFSAYRKRLGSPELIDVLPVQKTVQFPANAINANEGTSDGNWEVLTSLLNQVSS